MTKKLFFILFIGLIFRLILAPIVWHPDVNNHIDWGIRFWDYGPKMFYAPEANVWSYTWPNQPPGTIYLYAGIRKLFEATFDAFWQVNLKVPAFPSGILTYFQDHLYPGLLKLPSILADIGIGYLIYKIISHEKFEIKNKEIKARLATILWLVNPVIWYNSSVWGQTDALINFFALLSLYLLIKRRLTFAVLALALSFYIKVSLTIFLPLFVILIFNQKYKLTHLVVSVLVSLGIILLLTLPFAKGNPMVWLFDLYQKRILGQQLHVITANGFNIWATIAGIHERPNSLLLGPLSYKTWGSVLFGLAYLPSAVLVWKKQSLTRIIWSFAIIAFASFMFLSNMHERYLFPLFPYLTILAVTSNTLMIIYWLVSLISLLNLYNFWWIPRSEVMINFMSFGDRLMPRVLGFINFGVFALFYKKYLKSNPLFNK